MKVSIRIFDEDERKFLETILDLAARRLKVSLEHVASGVADVVFLKADEPGASLLINSSQTRRHPVVIVYGGTGYAWTLEKPATSRALVDLLGRLLEEFGIGVAPAVINQPQRLVNPTGPQIVSRPPEPPEPVAPVVSAEPVLSQVSEFSGQPLLPVVTGMQFMERLREMAAGRGRWVCQLDNSFTLCVDAAAGKVLFPQEYASRHPEVGRMSLGVSDGRIRPAASNDPAWDVSAASMPLESFLWLVAQMAEPLPVIEGAPCLGLRFRLQRWPSFSRILHGSSHIVMSGRLMKRAMTLTELVEVTGEQMESVIRFYNSACLCGLLQAGAAASIVAAPVMHRESESVDTAQLQEIRKGKAGIFSRVLKRLLG